MTETFQPVDLLAIALVLAVLIGCINYLWVKLPPAIGMLIGSLVLSRWWSSSDRLFHLHVMSWFRGTLDAASLPHVFLDGVLALLLFAGSLHVDVAELNRRRWMILLLATASVHPLDDCSAPGCGLVFAVVGVAVPLAWCLRARRDPGADRRRRGRNPAAAGRACRRACAPPSSARACSTTAPAWCCSWWRCGSPRAKPSGSATARS